MGSNFKNLLLIDANNKYGSNNRNIFFNVDNASNWKNLPSGITTGSTGIRLVYYASYNAITVIVIETTLNLGNMYFNFYSRSTSWSGWIKR